MFTRPDRSEAADYYFTYIDKVGAGDVRELLRAQLPEALSLLRGISEEQSRHRYGSGKWTIREVIGHTNDAERLFVFRAFWFARGLAEPLPSFDQDVAVANAASDDRSWHSLVEECRTIREATLTFFDNVPGDMWTRSGVASGHPVTVRALAYITAGHLTHHLKILRERYLA